MSVPAGSFVLPHLGPDWTYLRLRRSCLRLDWLGRDYETAARLTPDQAVLTSQHQVLTDSISRRGGQGCTCYVGRF